MKLRLKLVIFLGISLFLLILFAAFLLPSKGEVMDSVTIYASDSVVKEKLLTYKSYRKWFPWSGEKLSDYTFSKNSQQQINGFSFIGKGEKAGNKGKYMMKKIEGDSIFHYALRFKNMPDFYGSFLLKGNEKETVLAWKLNMRAGWKPWWRFYASMMSKITKPALTDGLAKFKTLCEQADR